MKTHRSCYQSRSLGTKTRGALSLLAGLLVTYSSGGYALTSKTTDKFYESAVATFYEGKLNHSVIHLKNALQADSDHLPSRILMAELQLAKGNGAGAEAELRRAQESGADAKRVTPLLIKALLLQRQFGKALEVPMPDNLSQLAASDLHVLHGHAHFGNNDFTQADAAYARAAELVPYNVSALLGQAQVALVEGRTDAAQAYANQVLQAAPANASALLLKASIHQHRGNTTEGMEAVNRLMIVDPDNVSTRMTRALLSIDSGDLTGALEDVEFALDKNALDPIANFVKYIIYVAEDRLLEADALLTDMAMSLLQMPVAFKEQFPIYHYLSGVVSFHQGEYSSAVTSLQRYRTLAGEDLKTLKLLAQVQLALGDPESARLNLEKADVIVPEDPMILTLLGDSHSRLGQLDKGSAYYLRAIELQPENPTPATSLARLYMQIGQPQHAIKLLQQPDLNASAPETLALMVKAQVAVGDLKESLAYSQRLLRQMPTDSPVHGLHGSILALSGDLEQAESSYRKALELDPGNRNAASGLSQIYLREAKPEAALGLLKDFREREGNDPALLIEIGDVYRLNGDLAKAVFWYEKARGVDHRYRPAVQRLIEVYVGANDLKDAVAVAEQYLLIVPNDADIHRRVAGMYMAIGRHSSAVDSLETVVRISPSKAQPLLALAKLQLEAGMTDGAVHSLEKAIESDASLLPAYLQLIDIASRGDDVEQALALTDQLEAVSSDKALANRIRGTVHQQVDRHDDAIKFYSESLDASPSAQATMGLFQIYKGRRQNDEAIKLLSGWVQQNPTDMLAAISLAELYRELRQLQKSSTVYEGLLSRFPNNVVVLNNTAFVKLELGELDRALQLAEIAHRKAPTNPNVMDTRAWIETQRGNYEAALPLLRQASEQDYDNADIKYHLAVTLDKLGRHEEAKQIIAQVSPGQMTSIMQKDALNSTIATRLAENMVR